MTNPVERSWRALVAAWLAIAVVTPLPFLRPRPATELRAQNKADQAPPKAAAGFNPRRVVAPFPAIKDAPFLPASKVRNEVSENELVLGVVVEGEARAYPINMLTGPRREIINDTLGGRAIAATW